MKLEDLESLESNEEELLRFNYVLHTGVVIKIHFDLDNKKKRVLIGKMLSQIQGYQDSRGRTGELIRRFYLKDYGEMKFRWLDVYRNNMHYRSTGYFFDFEHIGEFQNFIPNFKFFLGIIHNFTRGYYKEIEFHFYKDWY